jgi:hypothetical protein
MKKILLPLGALIVLGIAFYAFNSYIYHEKQEPNEQPKENVAPQGKIDPKVACESALAYTTFTDDAAAEVFVSECIAGQHPDVIQRYIESLGVDGSAI